MWQNVKWTWTRKLKWWLMMLFCWGISNITLEHRRWWEIKTELKTDQPNHQHLEEVIEETTQIRSFYSSQTASSNVWRDYKSSVWSSFRQHFCGLVFTCSNNASNYAEIIVISEKNSDFSNHGCKGNTFLLCSCHSKPNWKVSYLCNKLLRLQSFWVADPVLAEVQLLASWLWTVDWSTDWLSYLATTR